MPTVSINRLACQHMHRLGVSDRNLIVRQIRMEIEGRDVFEQTQLVDVPESGKRRDLVRHLPCSTLSWKKAPLGIAMAAGFVQSRCCLNELDMTSSFPF